MSLQVGSSVYGSFRPLEVVLKLFGFLPIFWHDHRCQLVQRLLNWAGLALNTMSCFWVTYYALDPQRKYRLNNGNFARKTVIYELVAYVTPLVLIVLGFVFSGKIKQIFHKLYRIDYKASLNNSFKKKYT